MNKNISESNKNLKVSLELKDVFAKSRHDEKKELIILRDRLYREVINLRDKFSAKRHNERIELINTKFNINDDRVK